MVQAAFDNTIRSTYTDGRVGKLWLDPDGTYTGEGPARDPSSGRWLVKGQKLCFKQRRPVPMFFLFCTPIVEGGVGASWHTKSPYGEPITVTLVEGR